MNETRETQLAFPTLDKEERPVRAALLRKAVTNDKSMVENRLPPCKWVDDGKWETVIWIVDTALRMWMDSEQGGVGNNYPALFSNHSFLRSGEVRQEGNPFRTKST